LGKDQEEGEIRTDVTPEYILRFFIALNNGFILDWCYRNGDYDLKEVLQESPPRMLDSFTKIKTK